MADSDDEIEKHLLAKARADTIFATIRTQKKDPDNIRYNLVINSKEVPEAVQLALLKHSFKTYEEAVKTKMQLMEKYDPSSSSSESPSSSSSASSSPVLKAKTTPKIDEAGVGHNEPEPKRKKRKAESSGYYATAVASVEKTLTPPSRTTHAPPDTTADPGNKAEKPETEEESQSAPPSLQSGAPPRHSTTITQVSADMVSKSRPNVVTGVVTKVPSQRPLAQPPTHTTHAASKYDNLKLQQMVRLMRCFKLYLASIDTHVAEAVQRTHRADDRLAETKLRQRRVSQYLQAINTRKDIGTVLLGDPLARAARMESFGAMSSLRPPSGLADSGRSLLLGLDKSAGLRAGEFPLADSRRTAFGLGDRGSVGEDTTGLGGEVGAAFGGQRKRRREEGVVHRSLSADPGAVPGALGARPSQAIPSAGLGSQRLRNNLAYPHLQAPPYPQQMRSPGAHSAFGLRTGHLFPRAGEATMPMLGADRLGLHNAQSARRPFNSRAQQELQQRLYAAMQRRARPFSRQFLSGPPTPGAGISSASAMNGPSINLKNLGGHMTNSSSMVASATNSQSLNVSSTNSHSLNVSSTNSISLTASTSNSSSLNASTTAKSNSLNVGSDNNSILAVQKSNNTSLDIGKTNPISLGVGNPSPNNPDGGSANSSSLHGHSTDTKNLGGRTTTSLDGRTTNPDSLSTTTTTTTTTTGSLDARSVKGLDAVVSSTNNVGGSSANGNGLDGHGSGTGKSSQSSSQDGPDTSPSSSGSLNANSLSDCSKNSVETGEPCSAQK